MGKQNNFDGTRTLRIYDTKLIDRLNRHYADSGTRYENKNHLLNELIEMGLNRREYENGLMDKLAATDANVGARLDWLSVRMESLEKYVMTRFDEIYTAVMLNQKLLNALYYIAETEVMGLTVTEQDLERVYCFVPGAEGAWRYQTIKSKRQAVISLSTRSIVVQTIIKTLMNASAALIFTIKTFTSKYFNR